MPPFNGSGSFSVYTPGNPVIPGTVISSTAYNATQQDIAAGLSNAVTRDGQSPLTANLPAAGRKITGLGAGVVAGDSLRFEQLFSQGSEQDIASAATVDIGALNTTIARITGTTTITSFGTNYNGPRFVRFAGVLTLTHNATTLILPGGANITTAAGDRAILTPVGNPGSGWQVLAYEVAALTPGTASSAATLSGTVAIANGGTGQTTAAAAFTAIKQAATDAATGVVELATAAEVQTGTDTTRAITPAGFSASSFGYAQNPATVTRTNGVTYTNTSGKPQFISFQGSGAGAIGAVQININSLGNFTLATVSAATGYQATSMIPIGATYVIAEINIASRTTTLWS